MAVALVQLVRFRGRAVKELGEFLEGAAGRLRGNRLLERFERRLDEMRIPLKTRYEPFQDVKRLRGRETCRGRKASLHVAPAAQLD